jgi:uncharacterized protein YjbJ (UPF0337 family)
MNKDQITGTLKVLKGKVQQAAGKLVDSKNLQAEGVRNQVRGKAERAIADANESVRQVLLAANNAASSAANSAAIRNR